MLEAHVSGMGYTVTRIPQAVLSRLKLPLPLSQTHRVGCVTTAPVSVSPNTRLDWVEGGWLTLQRPLPRSEPD
jgi:hypothetical protein